MVGTGVPHYKGFAWLFPWWVQEEEAKKIVVEKFTKKCQNVESKNKKV